MLVISTITQTALLLNLNDIAGVKEGGLLVLLVLIGLLIIKELSDATPATDVLRISLDIRVARLILNIGIVPFIYIFCYIIIYRVVEIIR